jgi:xanthine/uracil/vitamin C permease (AzgA family)
LPGLRSFEQTAHYIVAGGEEGLLKLGPLTSASVLISAAALMLIAALHHNGVPGSILLGMAVAAIRCLWLAWLFYVLSACIKHQYCCFFHYEPVGTTFVLQH